MQMIPQMETRAVPGSMRLRRLAGRAAASVAGLLAASGVAAAPVSVVAVEDPIRQSSFSLDFGAFGGVASAAITQTDFSLELDADAGTAKFVQYLQDVDALILPGGFSTGRIKVEVVEGSSTGAFDARRGEFNTTELYAVHFEGDLSAFQLQSPVILPSTSSGVVALSTETGGSVLMDWTGRGQLPNPFLPETFLEFAYTCQVSAAFAPEPETMLSLMLIPRVLNLQLTPGLENSLVGTLDGVLLKINAGKETAAINNLSAFINKVEAQSGKRIEVADADDLTASAEGTIQLLHGGEASAAWSSIAEPNPKGRNQR